MEKQEMRCAVCSSLLKTVEFNLETDNSEHCHIPLISIIENIIEQPHFEHHNICMQCYNLLNELDGIEKRQIEIRNQLKKYLEKCENFVDSKKHLDIINVTTEINDVRVLSCGDSIENVSAELLDIKPDVKYLNSHFDKTDVELDNEERIPNSNKEQIEAPVMKKKVKKKFPDGPPSYKCHCAKEFPTSGKLKAHMNTHNDHRPFICEICGQSYKHKNAFNIHMDMHNGINPFTCIYCNKSFTQKGALARHAPIHTGEMPYQCDECGKRFIHRTSFHVHRLSHTGLKSYKCSLCDLALMSTSHLKRHMRIHTGEKKFACSTCGKRFAEKYNLAVHEKLHNNPCSSVSQKRTYSCPVCGVSYERKVKLEEHLVKEHQTIKTKNENCFLINNKC